jgi:hypothetical protein
LTEIAVESSRCFLMSTFEEKEAERRMKNETLFEEYASADQWSFCGKPLKTFRTFDNFIYQESEEI